MRKYKKFSWASSLFLLVVIFITVSDSTKAQTTIISNPYSSTISTSNTPSQNTVPVSNCVDFSYDLYQGLSDKANDKSVSKLQSFLNKKQFLKSEPNGYFGPATNSAVKSFQSKNNISSTGRVGPATRQVIRNLTCQAQTNTASIIEAVAPKPERINSSNLTVTNPYTGMILRSENKSPIEWKNIPNAIYDIKLEDKNGLGYGYITTSIGGNTYNWEVGKVFSAKSNSDTYVEPGTYRILLTSSNYRPEVPDQYSGLFTIVGRPLEIDTIIPNSVSNNVDNSLVLYGRGFDSSTMIYYSNENISREVKPDYISSDGKIAVFKIRSQSTTGQYSLYVYNTYSSGATSTPSNAVNLIIKN